MTRTPTAHARSAPPRAVFRRGGLAAIALLATALLASSAGADDITMVSTITANKGPSGGTQTLYVTDQKMRTTDGQTDTIVDYASGEMTFIEHKKKRYWTTTPAEVRAQFDQLAEMLEQTPMLAKLFGGAGAEATVEKLGARTVAGYECDEYRVSVGEAYVMDVCATSQIQPPVDVHEARKLLYANMGPMAGKINHLFDALGEIEGLGLASTMRIKVLGQNIETTSEATEVKLGPVPPDTFEIPAGYKKAKSPFGG